ncbi:MAG: alpha/beta hydrolase family protein [Gammaproteobacteria bacterium]
MPENEPITESIEPQALRINTADGYRLAAHLVAAKTGPRAAALIVPAMAVPQSYYAPLAVWLAERGYDVLTFDFRGIGESAPRTLRGFEADILTWARQDAAAMLAFARRRAPGRPLVWIGHSLGGQILAMTPGNEAISAAVTVASGVGYWRENAYPLRYYSWFLWFVAAPLATAFCGYFPGRALRMVGDLPKGVIGQWSRWCRHPEYAVGVEGPVMRELYCKVRLPLLSLSFTDDEYMSERNVAVLHGFYANARRDMRRISPREHGLRRVGHFGFFRPQSGGQLWPAMLEWLERPLREGRAD